jgi:hypothetical protein
MLARKVFRYIEAKPAKLAPQRALFVAVPVDCRGRWPFGGQIVAFFDLVLDISEAFCLY